MEEKTCAISIKEMARNAGFGRTGPRSGVPRLPASKAEIRLALREIYNRSVAKGPNINQAWDSIKMLIQGAPRSRVREVLSEPEFARLRREPGKRRFVSAAEIPAAKLSNR